MNSADQLRFLYIGQIREEKGVDHVIAAAEILLREGREFKVSIAGEMKGWAQGSYGDRLIRHVEGDALLKANITFLGHVENVDAAFNAHDAHIAPSTCEEAYGLVVVEAKQNHRASIIYRSGGMVELVEHLHDGLICGERTSVSLAAAMRIFLDTPAQAGLMGENAFRSLSRLGLSRDTFQLQWNRVITSAVSHGRRLHQGPTPQQGGIS